MDYQKNTEHIGSSDIGILILSGFERGKGFQLKKLFSGKMELIQLILSMDKHTFQITMNSSANSTHGCASMMMIILFENSLQMQFRYIVPGIVDALFS